MATEIKKIDLSIVQEEKEFNRLIEKVVDDSGKITLPKSLINKKVCVVWMEEDIKKLKNKK